VPAPNDRQDTLGTELLGDIFYNLWFNVTPRRDNALTGDPGIMLVGESALLPPRHALTKKNRKFG
jgi:hypothetical protein